jgi:hypothetical protein
MGKPSDKKGSGHVGRLCELGCRIAVMAVYAL